VKWIRNLPLRAKLRAVIMVTSGVALLLTSSAFVVYDYFSFRDAAARRLQILAEVLANQCIGAIDFDDRGRADTILAKVSIQKEILTAQVFAADGEPFSKYRNGSANPDPNLLLSRPGGDGLTFTRGRMEVTQPILRQHERIGTIYLCADLREAADRAWTNVAIVGTVVLLATLIALLLSAQLEQFITGPISHLADIVNKVTTQRDYTARAEKHGDDELGVLIEGLNDMLSQIQVRDGALQLARNELELRVEERTAQLTFLNEEMKNEVAERKRAEESMRESEERYRQLVELSPDAIVIHSAGRFVYVNSAALSLLGATSPDQLVGKPVLEIVSREMRGEVAGRIRKVYEGGYRSPLYEEKIIRLDGTPLDVETASISFVHQGQPAAQVIIRDITQRKEIEQMKNEFVSTVSHELRTPITSIQGSLGLIANGVMGALPPAAKPLVDIAYKNCQRLVLLINDILDMEKIAAGKMKFAFKPLEIGPLVEQTIESNRSYGAQFGATFQFRNDSPGVLITGDNDRLIQVITNLLSNAAKFSPRGGTVDVTVSERDGWVRVGVADHGPGIPEEFRKRIFQKFSQADSSDMRQKGGTGLGLAITKTIVEKHGGKVSFESETGRGTTFNVDLPVYEEAHADIQRQKPDTPHILICEDDPQIAGFIRLVLSKDGIRSDIAGDTVQAARMLAENRYDAMTLDLMLPDRDGMSFLEELRSKESTRALPVIVVSAAASTHPDLLKGAALQVMDCLDKPIDQQRLLSAARMAVRSKSAATARVLHVEQDPDIRQLVAHTLRSVAETAGAATLADARARLEKEPFDLVVLNVDLPDGSGMELVPLLNGSGRARVPVVFFNAKRSEAGATHLLASTLVKSLAAQSELPETIQSWIRSGTSEHTQGAKT
jgi:PAS domain S-box-containing protein